ncbi:glycerate dehydrogenase [Tatumella sp. TA1]|uniref:NAD(P)-dependent oxidoreductase n=1 Tax=Rosenbergiella collisarenosi TaxID=1544695 RepID=UPI0008F7FCFA|nr:NAD(P)-dependent oxidoreductase [Rosenbergiella collisarenosi]MBT0720691.1 glycerate dehydrogenase [Rosenbergiella collisarenosi]QGX91737.1 glycerate dehydrogenase [Tatumella sp. TA1]
MKLSAVLLDEELLFCEQADIERLAAVFYHFARYPHTAEEQCVERLRTAQVVITNGTPLTREILEQSSQLQLILVGGTGSEYVDREAATELGIALYNCQDYGTGSLAQHTFALILGLTNGLVNYQQTLRTPRWQQAGTFCLLSETMTELQGKRLVIVGYGIIGQRVSALAQAFGMEVLLAELPGRPLRAGRLALDELLPSADIVSLHCPLTPETAGLFSVARLALMKPSAYLINTARGAIVDESALANALRQGELAGAGLDVFAQEPLPLTHPLLDESIRNKVILTPHVAWASTEARQQLLQQLIENVDYFLVGDSSRRIN